MTVDAWIATRKGLFPLQRDDGAWHLGAPRFLGEPVSSVLAHRDGTVYAALRLGHFGVKLHRSRDHGVTWEEAQAPTYPPKPQSVPVEQSWSLDQIWVMEFADPNDSRKLWAGTAPGGLFYSGDGGTTWTLNRPLWDRPERAEWFGGGNDQPGIHSIVVDPRDARHISLAVSCGGVWQTRDAGETWSCTADGMRAAYLPPGEANKGHTQDPHRMVVCPGAPDTLWVQHHNDRYRSTDGGLTWTTLDNTVSAFGFAVAAHPHDPKTAWFVPAIKDELRVPVDGRLVVTQTRDGGKSFDVLAHGLPQTHAYDLIYRHGLDVDRTGEMLLLGSTTGSLWISDDAGADWEPLSAHLPPIYAVRFTG